MSANHSLRTLSLLMAVGLPSLAMPRLPSQPPSNWTTVTLPANQTTPPNSIGTTVTFQTTDSVWLYSGITKEWTVLPVSGTPTVFQANDYCIVRDGNSIHAFASHTGEVDTITTSGSATVVSGSASSSWVTLVADGTQAWGFGAFHGRWASLTLSQPNPTMVTSRLTGLLQDGTTVYGLSAHHGTFVGVAADANAVLSLVGEAEVGTAHSPGVFRAFSAQQNTWGVQNVPTSVATLQQNEYAMAWAGNQIWAFSGLCGVLDTYTANNSIPAVSGAEGVAGFIDGGDVVCYGSGRGRFVARAAPTALLRFDYHFALLVDNAGITPFSAVTGAFGPPIGGSFTVQTNDAIAFAEDGAGGGYAYSPIRNDWTATPAVSVSSAVLVRDAVVLVEALGYQALSARHGTWVPLATASVGNYMAPANSATFLAFDGGGNTVHVFDARLNRWASVTGQAPFIAKVSRHTAMVHDTFTAFGFGQPSGEWYSVPLSAAPSSFDTASSIGNLVHGTQISVYSVQGSFSYTGRYPEFTQAINLGATLRLHQVAAPGSAFALMFGSQHARIDLGPALGHLYIDPAGLASIPWPQVIGVSGILHIDLPIPNNRFLVGSQIQLQTVVLEPAATMPWLSTSVAPVLF
ncbi:MAG: hypothetical protein R3F56_21470 [Planctomycetota bacterium]